MSKQVIQRHHITYPGVADRDGIRRPGRNHPPLEWIVPVTKGEHYLITQLQRFTSLSAGAKSAILYELALKPDRPLNFD
jgi:hypothetical protein